MTLTERARRLLLPAEARPEARLLFWGRALRAFGDGFVSLLLPAYLTVLGFDAFAVGVIGTATLLGSAALTLAVGFLAARLGRRTLLVAASLLMIGTGLGFVLEERFWPLALIAFVGTLNPSSGDVSLFLPLEQALLADCVPAPLRTRVFAGYSLVGSLVAALGALAAGAPALLRGFLPLTLTEALQAMFALYALLGLAAYHLYRRLPARLDARPKERTPPLRQSRRIVLTLAALFSIDAFGGGLLVQSLLALWFFDRFGLSLAAAGTVFFWSGLLAAVSYLAAARIAERIGLVNTMVFTHLPSNLCLVAMPFAPNLAVAIALFLLRSLLSSMDVPPRAAFVMAVVTPAERPAAASVTLMPRGLAAALGPVLAGAMLAASPFGWPLVAGGVVKSVYDLMLLALFRHHRPPGEGGAAAANESAAP